MSTGVRTGGLGKSMGLAVVSYFVTTLGTMATNYLTPANVSPVQGALISTGVGLAVVMITVLIDRGKNAPQEIPNIQRPRAKGWMSGVTAVLIIVLLCGVGGFGVTYGAQWVGDKFVSFVKAPWDKDADESGKQRLTESVSKTDGPLTITVTGVEVTSKITKVMVTAASTTDQTIHIPVFGSCQLTVPGSPTIQPEMGATASRWTEQVPPNSETSGTIIFAKPIPDGASKITISFTGISSFDFGVTHTMSLELPLQS